MNSRSDNLVIRVARPLRTSLEEMAKAAAVGLENFISQLVEAEIAAYRSRKLSASVPLADKECEPIKITHDRRTKLPPAKIQRLLFLRNSGLSVPELAKRFGVGTTSVARILRLNKEAVHVPIPFRGAGNAEGKISFSLGGSSQRRAK